MLKLRKSKEEVVYKITLGLTVLIFWVFSRSMKISLATTSLYLILSYIGNKHVFRSYKKHQYLQKYVRENSVLGFLYRFFSDRQMINALVSTLYIALFFVYKGDPHGEGNIQVIYRGTFDQLAPLLAKSSRELIDSGKARFDGAGKTDFEGISLVIPIRDEDEFIGKTVSFTLALPNRNLLKEIIIVDDCSKREVTKLLNEQLPSQYYRYIKVIRLDKCEGLIRSRILGADASSSSVIVFMDGHCRPKDGWIQPLIDRLKKKPRAIVCPMIEDIDRYTWRDIGTFGLKMMFDWNFEFNWYEDFTETVPIASGGLYAITREWWDESGKYDPGMLEWGGENIEQSIRIWRCGGEIVSEKKSRVGHIFKRDPKPNPENKLVLQVQRNQKRAALVWLDRKRYRYFETIHSVVQTLNETESGVGLGEREEIKDRLGCKPFSWYVNKFRASFDREGLLLDNFRHLKHRSSGLCLTASHNEVVTGTDDRAVVFKECDKNDDTQKWAVIFGRRLILNGMKRFGCLTRGPRNVVENSILRVIPCEFKASLEGGNDGQFWKIDVHDNLLFDDSFPDSTKEEYSNLRNSFRIFNSGKHVPPSPDGNDRVPVDGSEAFRSSSRCITNLNNKAVMKWCPEGDDEAFKFDPVKLSSY